MNIHSEAWSVLRRPLGEALRCECSAPCTGEECEEEAGEACRGKERWRMGIVSRGGGESIRGDAIIRERERGEGREVVKEGEEGREERSE
jgi:hypothetical protein